MSGRGRGGRGGRGGGRGGRGGRPGSVVVGGIEHEWNTAHLDDEIEVFRKPQPLFPDYDVEPPAPPTALEQAQLDSWALARSVVRNGPLYSQRDDDAGIGRKRDVHGKRPHAPIDQADVFTGTKLYSARYFKQYRKMPEVELLDNNPRFFPKELHSVLGLKHRGEAAGGAGTGAGPPTKKRPSVQHDPLTKVDRLQMEENIAREEQASEAGDEEEDANKGTDDEGAAEADEEERRSHRDDSLEAASQDSEEYDDDYNAERYFDNADDDYGAGEDEGNDEYFE